MLRSIIIIFSGLVFSVSSSPKCTVFEYRLSKFDRNPDREEITCRNVPPNLIINNFHFDEKSHPQDLIITESTIPTIANYSSLLNMRHIRTLHLKDVGIKSIVPGAFRNMKNLEELDLSHNKLTEVPDGAFVGLKNLRRLDLTANNISVYAESAFTYMDNLKSVEITGNPGRDIHTGGFSVIVKTKADENDTN